MPLQIITISKLPCLIDSACIPRIQSLQGFIHVERPRERTVEVLNHVNAWGCCASLSRRMRWIWIWNLYIQQFPRATMKICTFNFNHLGAIMMYSARACNCIGNPFLKSSCWRPSVICDDRSNWPKERKVRFTIWVYDWGVVDWGWRCVWRRFYSVLTNTFLPFFQKFQRNGSASSWVNVRNIYRGKMNEVI